MLYLFFFACGDAPQNEPVQEKISHKKSLVTYLSARDNTISCSSLSSPQLQQDLTEIVDTVERPPWVAMRAAACLSDLYPKKSKDDLARWISAPNKKGLAFLIAGKLSKLPDATAISIAKAGLEGPHALDIRVRLEKQNDVRFAPLLSPKKK